MLADAEPELPALKRKGIDSASVRMVWLWRKRKWG